MGEGMYKKSSVDYIYKLDGRVPLSKAIPFGLQHILAMFVANITPIILVAGACGLSSKQTAMLIQSAMIIAGIGTMVQLFPLWKIGSGLPIIMGISFTFVSVLCVIGAQYGYGVIMGAVLVGGIIEGILGLLAKYWIRIITPIVSANVVTAIGFSLLVVGANSFGGGAGSKDFGSATNWILGTVTLVCCLLFHIFAKGYFKQLSVLFGLIVGYILAIILGKVDFSALDGVSLIALPHFIPFKPEFNIGAILSVTLKETSGAIACDGFVSAFSTVFGCIPITSFSQNIGLIAMTKVVNRMVISTGAVIMLLAGIFPSIGAILATLPDAVLGGCTIMMFGNIVISGLQMLGRCGFSQRNITITALSLSVGIGFTQVPEIFAIFPETIQNVFAQNCVAIVFLMAVVLNLILPMEKENSNGTK